MLFNSIGFAFFLSIVFILYWFFTNRNLRFQNILLLIASYFFYAWWDWRFLLLLVIISIVNYYLGLIIQKSINAKRKYWLIIGIIINILVLSYFKYFNFFIDSFLQLFSSLGVTLQKPTLNIILPLGISFYIFLSLSYIIDIFQGKLKASVNLVEVLLTLSFFPIILAGPIQRPILLLPQIQKKRVFDYSFAIDGLKQILWGLFMKIVIADRCSVIVNNIFQNFTTSNGSTLLLGGIFYTVQIYTDFAGYSLIAIGVSKLFGFELMQNFTYPYFARDINIFWKRWHISLTSWFRDYVFLPIAYSVSRKISRDKMFYIKTDVVIYIIGISITWLLTGLWHGGNFTFLLWGMINGLFLITYHILKSPRKKFLKTMQIKNDNILLISFERAFTLLIIIFSWIVFRSDSVEEAFSYMSGIFSISLFNFQGLQGKLLLLQIMFFFLIEWIGRKNDYAIAKLGSTWRKPIRWAMYYVILYCIFYCYSGGDQQFIYFQF